MEDQKNYPIDRAVCKSLMSAVYLSFGLGIFLILSYLVYRHFIAQSANFIYILFPIFAIWFIIFGWMVYRLTKQAYLVTSPAGITFYSPGLELHTPWENLSKVGSMPTLFGLRKYDSLVLRQPGEQKCTWWFSLLRRKPEKEIPLSMYGNWRASELGFEIKKYAPHLFA